MVKTIVRVLVMSGVLAVFATATQASQAAGQDGVSSSNREQKSIVGSWLGTFDNGERILMSFTSDGIALSSVQTEVSLTQPVLTPGHGVWTRLDGRRFALTSMVILYDIQTGEYRGFGKLSGVLTVDKDGDSMSGTPIVNLFGPDGNPFATFPHPVRFARMKIEPLD
jgi:hypothetical protein